MVILTIVGALGLVGLFFIWGELRAILWALARLNTIARQTSQIYELLFSMHRQLLELEPDSTDHAFATGQIHRLAGYTGKNHRLLKECRDLLSTLPAVTSAVRELEFVVRQRDRESRQIEPGLDNV
jgi:hypothetical protein